MSQTISDKLPEHHSVEEGFQYDLEKAWTGKMKVADIIVGDRMRQELKNIEGMMESLVQWGQIQNVLVDSRNRLMAGGRRITAMLRLGWEDCLVTKIPFKGEIEHLSIELEENIQREDMTWLEKARTIEKIHKLRVHQNILEGRRWTQKQTGHLFNTTHGDVGYVLAITSLIDQGYKEFEDCVNLFEALKKLASHREAEATKLVHEQSKELQQKGRKNAENLINLVKTKTDTKDQEVADMTFAEVPNLDESAPKKEKEEPSFRRFIERAQKLLCCGDSLDMLLPALPSECIDHIFTDPPYGIPMENLEAGVTNLEVTSEEHDAESNIEDFPKFLEQAFRVLKPKGFCVFFCDVEHFGLLKKIGTEIGFSCQPHPMICEKEAGRNNAPFHNTTKDYECVAIFRKQGAQLLMPIVKSVIEFKFDPGEKKKFVHPFAKPRSLSLRLLKMFATPGQRILDPYCGECSMITAMIAYGVIPLGFDLKQDNITRGLEHVAKELSSLKQLELFD